MGWPTDVCIMRRRGAMLLAMLFAINFAIGGAERSRYAYAGLEQSPGVDWPTGGCDYTEDHYSPLSRIDTKTIQRLGDVNSQKDWTIATRSTTYAC
jgi:hypothetical protein